MEIKLSEALRVLNVGLASLKPILSNAGKPNVTPNTRIDKKMAQLIISEVRPKLTKEQSQSLLALFEEEQPVAPAKKEHKKSTPEVPPTEVHQLEVESLVGSDQVPTLKVLGHYDLESKKAIMNDTPIEIVADAPQKTAPTLEDPVVSPSSAAPSPATSTHSTPQSSTPEKSQPAEIEPSKSKTTEPERVEVKEVEKPKKVKSPKIESHSQEQKGIAKPSEVKKERPQTPAPEKQPKQEVVAAPKEEKTPEKPQVKEVQKESKEKEKEVKQLEEKTELREEYLASNKIYRPTETQEVSITVLGKIDLSAISPTKKSKRKRNRIGGQAVDVKSEAAKGIDPVAPNTRKAGNKPPRSGNNSAPAQGSNNPHKRKKDNAPVVAKQEVSEEDVQKQVKETLARLQGKKTIFEKKARLRKGRRDAARLAAEEANEADREAAGKTIKLTEYVTVSDLASLMDVPVNEVIATCMSIDMMVSINMRLDEETIKLVAEEFGFETEFVSADVVEAIQAEEEVDSEEDLEPRAPIVTVMGHVDHGKTSLLDNIRKTNVIAGEAGGITQHIGSYNVKLSSGRHITFLDTPGHEAFTAMRARGAQATDIAIIIIAANDQVMPQTKEAINHAAAAGVPIVFAINKIDVSGADPQKIREQLANLNYLVEDWGGKYQCQEISAKKGIGVSELLDKVLLEADILDLKANPKRRAQGLIIESSLDKGRGYVSNVLVHKGTLRVGDVIIAGQYYGRVKAMFNERNQSLKKTGAGPSVPATILGFNGAPSAGDTFMVLESEQEAREIANRRTQLQREQSFRTQKMLSLDEVGRRIAIGNFQELNLIIKGDVDGSVEVLSDSLIKLSTEEIGVNVIHRAVGQISESDVVLAKASQAIIIGFQVRPSAAARKNAEQEGVEIRTYSIIYDAIEEVKSAMEGMLSPEIKEVVTASLDVQQTFTIGKVGTIAGCLVKEGKIKRTDKVRVIRDGIVIYSGELESLKRFKDDVKEVALGLDCGLNIRGFNNLQEGDVIESYEEIEIKKTL